MKTSGLRRIAERYVRALFEVAGTAHALDAVEKDMVALADALEQNEDFQQFLTNPLLSRPAQTQAMEAVLAKLKANKTTVQFIVMLAGKRRLAILPEIAELFSEWAAAARGELRAELVAAAPMQEKEIALVSERLSHAYGKKINLAVKQDPALLGGVMVKIGSIQLDGSLAGKLQRLGLALKAA